jgi:hypothetical protein
MPEKPIHARRENHEPDLMNQTTPQQHDDAARSLPQVEGCAIASFRRPASGSHRTRTFWNPSRLRRGIRSIRGRIERCEPRIRFGRGLHPG